MLAAVPECRFDQGPADPAAAPILDDRHALQLERRLPRCYQLQMSDRFAAILGHKDVSKADVGVDLPVRVVGETATVIDFTIRDGRCTSVDGLADPRRIVRLDLTAFAR